MSWYATQRAHSPSRTPRVALAAAVMTLMALFTGGPTPAVGAAQEATAATAAAVASSGNVYWVAPNGSNTAAGTQNAPWQDLRAAIERLAPGDTLYVKPGTYGSQFAAIRPNLPKGTAARPITVQAVNDQVYLSKPLALDEPTHLIIDGVNIGGNGARWQGGSAIQYLLGVRGGEGWTVRNSKFCCFGTYGIVHIYGPAKNWTFSHNMVWSNPGRGAQSDTDHLVYVHTDRGSGPGYIERNVLAGSSNGANIKVGAAGPDTPNAGTANVNIRRNTLMGGLNNIRLAFEAAGTVVEDNITLNANLTWPNGPAAVQPYCLSGRGNVTRQDLWWGPPTVRHTDPIRGTYCRSTGQWTDQGGHVKRNPQLPATTAAVYNQRSLTALRATQFVPRNAAARPYGRWGAFDQTLVGDWDGDGVDTPGGVIGNRVYLTNAATDAGNVPGVTPGAGEAQRTIAYGNQNMQFLAGDWNGDGTDEIGAFDAATATFYLRDAAGRTRSFRFGSKGGAYAAIAGDWNGDGIDEVGLMETVTKRFHLRFSAQATAIFLFGSKATSYRPVAGDWNGDGADEIGLWQPNARSYHLRGCATATCTRGTNSFQLGSASEAPYYQPIAGTWSAGAQDTVGLVRETVWSRARTNRANPGWFLRNFEG